MSFLERNRKKIFYVITAGIFLSILAYNCLTPYLSDDLTYKIDVRDSKNFAELWAYAIDEYMIHLGRFLPQMNLRFSLALGKGVFNVLNSFAFTGLVLLIYKNISNRREYDITMLLLSNAFLWFFGVNFGETMLWNSGSCNYLWGMTAVMGLITAYKYLLAKGSDIKCPALVFVLILLLGVLVGQSSENTSGGALLAVLIIFANYFFDLSKEERKKIPGKTKILTIVSAVGILIGMAIMLLSPGTRTRAAYMDEYENHSGITRYLSHIYKVTVSVRELFFTLLAVILLTYVILILQKQWKNFKDIRNDNSIVFLFTGLATSYALVVVTLPPARAFYGAGIFFIVAALDGISKFITDKAVNAILKYSLTGVLCLWLFFTYFENLVNLARIYREESSRVNMIEQAVANGETKVVIPQYHPEFDNPYTTAYDAQIEEDPEYWINTFYERYYKIDEITAIPYEEWEEIYGKWE